MSSSLGNNFGVGTLVCVDGKLIMQVGDAAYVGQGFIRSLDFNMSYDSYGEINVCVGFSGEINGSENITEIVTSLFSEFDLMKEINRRWQSETKTKG